MKVVMGLGNPGTEHVRDRHNVGSHAVDRLAARWGISVERAEHRALLGLGSYREQPVMLVKPQTYMNRSGESASSIAGYFRLPPEAFVILHDDMDLPLGRLRIRRDGGAGGHRGIASVIDQLGSPDFSRVRIGIGRPPDGLPASEFVLGPFVPTEAPAIDVALGVVVEAVETLLACGVDAAMNRYNGNPRGSECAR
jgi:PTH1 family peptidyl-tRNA hydrolase